MIDNIFLNQRIVAGCMRISGLDEKGMEKYIDNAINSGVTYFDHADIYGAGECEKIFGKALKNNPSLREKITIQTKTGIIRGKHYDFSKEHILESVNESLKKLNTEYIDYLLLHRPDALCEHEEVAEAFEILHSQGKVRNFGVSNHTPYQIDLLKKYTDFPIKINQLQFSVLNASMVTSGICANTQLDGGINRDGGVLDYCRANDIVIQAWSPLQHGLIKGVFIGNDDYKELNNKLEEIAGKYNVSSATIAMAWILRHPAKMQVICGTTNPVHFKDATDAVNVKLTRDEWYEIYKSAGHNLP